MTPRGPEWCQSCGAVASGPEVGEALSAQDVGLMPLSGRRGGSHQLYEVLLPGQAMSFLSPGCQDIS